MNYEIVRKPPAPASNNMFEAINVIVCEKILFMKDGFCVRIPFCITDYGDSFFVL